MFRKYIILSLLTKRASRAGFGPQTVVWIPLLQAKRCCILLNTSWTK